MKTSRNWTDADIACIADLIVEGKSFSKIGDAIGATKNAVIGFVRRTPKLNELNRIRASNKSAKQTKEEKNTKNAERKKAHRAEQVKLAADFAPVTKTTPKPKTTILFPFNRRDVLQTAGRPLSELGNFECRWAVNDADQGQEHLFCGFRIEAGSRYCSYHKAKAFGTGTYSERTAHHISKKQAA